MGRYKYDKRGRIKYNILTGTALTLLKIAGLIIITYKTMAGTRKKARGWFVKLKPRQKNKNKMVSAPNTAEKRLSLKAISPIGRKVKSFSSIEKTGYPVGTIRLISKI